MSDLEARQIRIEQLLAEYLRRLDQLQARLEQLAQAQALLQGGVY